MKHKKHISDWYNTDWRVFLLITVLAFGIVNIQGCSTIGYENADTTRKAIVVANAEIRAANLLLQDLVTRNAISDASAISALNSLRDAHATLQAALDALVLSGDPAAAESALERVNSSLSLVILLLSTYTGDP